MSDRAAKTPAAEAMPAESQDFASARESRPVPFMRGTRLLAGLWLMEPTDEIDIQAPDDKPAKK